MAVEKEARLGALDVRGEGFEADVNVIVSVVNVAWRIVGNKHVNRWKCGEHSGHLVLGVEMMAARLVLPRALKAAEGQSSEGFKMEVQIDNRSRKWRVAVVVSFDGEDA